MRPVWSLCAADVLAASDVINERKISSLAFSSLLAKRVEDTVFVTSKDLFMSLATRPNFTDKCITVDTNAIQFMYAVCNVDLMYWLLVISPFWPGTKKDILLCLTPHLLLCPGQTPIDLLWKVPRLFDCPLGWVDLKGG